MDAEFGSQTVADPHPMIRNKPSLRATSNKGAVGRLIATDPWGNGASILLVKGTDLQDPELVYGLQPKTVAVECLRLSHPRITPDGWSKEAAKDFSTRWQTIKTPEGQDLWLRMDTGQTQYSSPIVTEVKGEAVNHKDQPAQARDSLIKTVPKARIIPNRVVVNTSGAQYERWEQTTSKELQAFLKTVWKEPTPELRARYFAAKKKVVTQLLVFSLKPITAEKKAQGLVWRRI